MRLGLILVFTLIAACTSRTKDGPETYRIGEIIYEESFDVADSSAWVIESEDDVHLNDCVANGSLILDVPRGITAWNTTRYDGNVLFEFEVTVVEAGGKNDRVSDLNCFWMATDPDQPDDFFQRSSWRNGIFWRYYSLNLYYVGFGGHDNTKTRFRRYDVSVKPPPPILKEYDDSTHLIKPNQRAIVRIVCYESRIIYFFNGEKLFDIVDENPYREGYFGFRTVNNHMRIESFKVFSVEAAI